MRFGRDTRFYPGRQGKPLNNEISTHEGVKRRSGYTRCRDRHDPD